MTSIYQRALGEEFDRLHPRVQRRFGISSDDGVCLIGTGVMDEVTRGPWWTVPFLMFGASRRVLFPSRGRDVPFQILNYAYVDTFGRETVTWARRFRTKRRLRAFDATMVYSQSRGRVIDYLGTHQHLAVDVHLWVDSDGAMCLRTSEQRFYEKRVGFRFPAALTGQAEVREWWDEEHQVFRIKVEVRNRIVGHLFGYRGWFVVRESPCQPDEVPLDVKPLREERRE